jgi:Protein of unknown function (DUF4246)
LYSIIEKIVDKAIPLWNLSLFPLNESAMSKYQHVPRIPYTEQQFDPDPDQMDPEDGPQHEAGESDESYWERRTLWEESVRRVVLPNPGEFKPPKPIEVSTVHPTTLDLFTLFLTRGMQVADLVDLKRDYARRGLQIIVKLANIELTPEKPKYEGGTWHIEGQLVRPPKLFLYFKPTQTAIGALFF